MGGEWGKERGEGEREKGRGGGRGGMDVNLESDDGKTPLFFACQSGKESLLLLLIKYGLFLC